MRRPVRRYTPRRPSTLQDADTTYLEWRRDQLVEAFMPAFGTSVDRTTPYAMRRIRLFDDVRAERDRLAKGRRSIARQVAALEEFIAEQPVVDALSYAERKIHSALLGRAGWMRDPDDFSRSGPHAPTREELDFRLDDAEEAARHRAATLALLEPR